MLKISLSRSVDRAPQDVFDFVADPANNPRWQGPTVSAQWTSEVPPGNGSTLSSVARFLGRALTFDYEVTTWDPPVALVLESVGGSPPFVAAWRFEADHDGGTTITVDIESNLTGPAAVAARLVRTMIEKQLESDLDALARLLEGEGA